jgi:hypothetical protein
MGSVAIPGEVATGFPSTPATFHRPTSACRGDIGSPGIARPGITHVVAEVAGAVVAGGGATGVALAIVADWVGPTGPFRGPHAGATAIDNSRGTAAVPREKNVDERRSVTDGAYIPIMDRAMDVPRRPRILSLRDHGVFSVISRIRGSSS